MVVYRFSEPMGNHIFLGGTVMNWFLEIFGYMGTALVLISMMMTSVTKLRCINIAGSLISMIYAIIVGAYPVVFLNAGLIIINALQLIIRPRSARAISGNKIKKGNLYYEAYYRRNADRSLGRRKLA